MSRSSIDNYNREINSDIYGGRGTPARSRSTRDRTIADRSARDRSVLDRAARDRTAADRSSRYRSEYGRTIRDREMGMSESDTLRNSEISSRRTRRAGNYPLGERPYEPDFIPQEPVFKDVKPVNGKKKKNKRRLRKKYQAIASVLSLIIVLVICAASFFIFKNLFADKISVNTYVEDNTLTIIWDKNSKWDAMGLYIYDDTESKYIEHGVYDDGIIQLEDIEEGQTIRFELQPIKYSTGMSGKEKHGSRNEFEVNIRKLTAPILSEKIDTDNKRVELSWIVLADAISEIYKVDDAGERELIQATTGSGYLLEFPTRADLPGKDEVLNYEIRYGIDGDGYMQYSAFSNIVSVSRNDLLSDEIYLNVSLNEDNTAKISFNETREDIYELQYKIKEKATWITLEKFDSEDDLTCTTKALPSERNVLFRVIAYDEDNRENINESSHEEIRTKRTVTGSAIWPIKALDVYSEAACVNKVGTIEGGDAAMIVSEDNGKFLVSYKGGQGYVDSNYCMINLPDYLGDTCQYNITNSYSSIFRVQDYDIADVTDEIIPGFDDVCVSDNEYLVPYLYPCANKLSDAAKAAKEDGYILRIYEAYRPHEATRYLYDTVLEQLDNPVIMRDEEGNIINDNVDPETGEELSEEEIEIKKNRQELELLVIANQAMAEQGINTETPEGALALQQYLEELRAAMYGISYRQAMTDGRFQLSAFLAAVTSAHNRGIALDLTLVKIDSDEELEMQSKMHDLSFRSIRALNNDNAQLLNKYMTGAGFNDLSSEWWHFQDDETRNAISLNVYLEKGVSTIK